MKNENELLYKEFELEDEDIDENNEILYTFLEERFTANFLFKELEYSEKSQEYQEELEKIDERDIEKYIDYSYSFLNVEELDSLISGIIDFELFKRIAEKRYNKYIENGGKEIF